jgi:hypothetical protein
MKSSTRRSGSAVKKKPQGAVSHAARLRTTLGELIVAAFDIAGNRVPDVAQLLASPYLGRAAHGRIVLVQ